MAQYAPDGSLNYFDMNNLSWEFPISDSDFLIYQGPLVSFDGMVFYITSDLREGVYEFYFGIDLSMNGVMDESLYFDWVFVNVEDSDDSSDTDFRLPDTGQAESYTSTWGEDSDYTINPPSYTDN